MEASRRKAQHLPGKEERRGKAGQRTAKDRPGASELVQNDTNNQPAHQKLALIDPRVGMLSWSNRESCEDFRRGVI